MRSSNQWCSAGQLTTSVRSTAPCRRGYFSPLRVTAFQRPDQDEIRGSLCHRHHRCLGVSRHECWQDADVHDAQTVQAVDPQLGIDYGVLVKTHPAAAGHVRERLRVGPQPRVHLVIVHVLPQAPIGEGEVTEVGGVESGDPVVQWRCCGDRERFSDADRQAADVTALLQKELITTTSPVESQGGGQLQLTAAGQEKLDTLTTASHDSLAELLDSWSPEQELELATLLHQVTMNLLSEESTTQLISAPA
jgi:hypothetical protein